MKEYKIKSRYEDTIEAESEEEAKLEVLNKIDLHGSYSDFYETLEIVDVIEKKLFLIEADAVWEAPEYTFMLKARNKEEARNKAIGIIKQKYKDWNEEKYVRITEVDNISDVKENLLLD